MKSFCCLLLAVAWLIVSAAGSEAYQNQKKPNQKPNNNQKQVQEQKQDVTEAKDDLQDLQRELREATTRKGKLETEQKEAAQNIKKVTEELETRYEKSTGVLKAREAQKAAQEVFDKASAPVLQKLKEKPEYKTATEAARTTATKLKAIREDTSLTPSQKAQQSVELTKITLRPGQIEQEALELDPAAKEARTKLAAAEQSVRDARKKMDAAVEADPKLTNAKSDLEKAEAAVVAVQKDIERFQQKVTSAQSKVSREQQQLQQKQTQQNQQKKKKDK